VALLRLLQCAALARVGASGTACSSVSSVDEAKLAASDFFASGDPSSADACLGVALAKLTSELERLAVEASSLRAYRAARRLRPSEGDSTGCVVDESGASVCLLGSSADGESVRSSSTPPQAINECMSDAEGTELMRRASRGELEIRTPSLDAAIVHAVRRQWWGSARAAVNLLRNSNTAVPSEARRVVTELRDEAGAVLNLMRQTKMDEATIHCACLWAQGLYSVHINVKFASRLDAPVTVLNVDDEVVHINDTHVSFTGVGRQKPKRYVVDLELFGPILANESTWSFGSVGTIKFVLKKATDVEWPSLTAPNSTMLSKSRVWWEKQEQVEAEDKRIKAARAKATQSAKIEEMKKEEEEQRRERERAHAQERELIRAQQAELRAAQLPHFEHATTTIDALVAAASEPASSQGASLNEAYEASLAATRQLLEATGQGANETAFETARQTIDKIKSLSALDQALTGDALQVAVEQYKTFCTSVLEPEPENLKKKESKKKKKKKAKSK